MVISILRFAAMSLTFHSTRSGEAERALGEHGRQLAPIFRAGVQIRFGLQTCSHALGKTVYRLRRDRLAAQLALFIGAQKRHRANAGEHQADIATMARVILLYDGGDSDEREVAVAPGKFGK